jgi:hypothetical protein
LMHGTGQIVRSLHPQRIARIFHDIGYSKEAASPPQAEHVFG